MNTAYLHRNSYKNQCLKLFVSCYFDQLPVSGVKGGYFHISRAYTLYTRWVESQRRGGTLRPKAMPMEMFGDQLFTAFHQKGWQVSKNKLHGKNSVLGARLKEELFPRK